MPVFHTSCQEEWLDLMNEEHHLKFDVSDKINNFYSDVITPAFNTPIPFVTTKTCEYEAKYLIKNNTNHKDNLLVTHSFGTFLGSQKQNIRTRNQTFILNLSESFKGKYITEGNTNAIILPYELLPSDTIDRIRHYNRIESPLFYAVEYILSRIHHSDVNINLALNTIISNLSLIECKDKKIEKYHEIKHYIHLSLANNKRITLDLISDKFYISKRKVQYIFEYNNTTFRDTIRSIKKDAKSLRNHCFKS